MPKHIARWILIFGGLIVLYYIYKSIMSVINSANNLASTLTSPITGAENLGSQVAKGVSNGLSTLWGDVTALASYVSGAGSSADTTQAPPAATVQAPGIPGWNVPPTPVSTSDGTSNASGAVTFNFLP